MHEDAGRRTRRNRIMMISLITAWAATICVIFTALKYFVKKNQLDKIAQSANRDAGCFTGDSYLSDGG